MTDRNAPMRRHKLKAREHLTALEKSRQEAQARAAEHLAKHPRPVREDVSGE